MEHSRKRCRRHLEKAKEEKDPGADGSADVCTRAKRAGAVLIPPVRNGAGTKVNDAGVCVGDGDDSEWSEEDHRHFVEAIFEVGLRNASPAVIMENMYATATAEGSRMITSERLKSKLQKYRKNREKSKQDFIDEYNAFMKRANALNAVKLENGTAAAAASPDSVLRMMGSVKPLGGETAAYLSYEVVNERKERDDRCQPTEGARDGQAKEGEQAPLLRKGALECFEDFGGLDLCFPVLSEEEKKTSLGVSMTLVMGLFLTMTNHLMTERQRGRDRDREGGNLKPKSKATGASVNGMLLRDGPSVNPDPKQTFSSTGSAHIEATTAQNPALVASGSTLPLLVPMAASRQSSPSQKEQTVREVAGNYQKLPAKLGAASSIISNGAQTKISSERSDKEVSHV